MRLRRESRILKSKALASFSHAVAAFNAPQPNGGRVTIVLMSTQHAFEMLLKAALVQQRVEVFDHQDQTSIGFEKCVNLSSEKLRVSPEEAGTLRAICALRDAEQHWYCVVSEGILYTHMRAAVTLFDELLQRAFNERLANHLPERVLPISTQPPRDLQTLIDEEYSQIRQLLQPGKRHGAEARGRIRTLVGLQAHAVEDLRVSERDVDRAERGIRGGTARQELLPNLATVGTEVSGQGINVTVHFTKTAGAPVRWAAEGEAAAAVKTEDLWKKYHWSRSKLADKLGLSWPHAAALRWKLGIDADDDYHKQWTRGKTVIDGYSDNAYRRMKRALETPDFSSDAIYQEYLKRPKDI